MARTVSANAATSSSRVKRPRLTRIAVRASSGGQPIAHRTWDGCAAPALHALPPIRQAREIQTDEQRILRDVPYAKAQDARKPLLSVSVKSNAVDVRKCGAQRRSRSAQAHVLCAHLHAGNRRRTAAADDPRHILRARAHIAFLCAAI